MTKDCPFTLLYTQVLKLLKTEMQKPQRHNAVISKLYKGP